MAPELRLARRRAGISLAGPLELLGAASLMLCCTTVAGAAWMARPLV